MAHFENNSRAFFQEKISFLALAGKKGLKKLMGDSGGLYPHHLLHKAQTNEYAYDDPGGVVLESFAINFFWGKTALFSPVKHVAYHLGFISGFGGPTSNFSRIFVCSIVIEPQNFSGLELASSCATLIGSRPVSFFIISDDSDGEEEILEFANIQFQAKRDLAEHVIII